MVSRFFFVAAVLALAVVSASALDAGLDLELEVAPVLDDTGSAAYTPTANLTQYSVKPVIDPSVTVDDELTGRKKKSVGAVKHIDVLEVFPGSKVNGVAVAPVALPTTDPSAWQPQDGTSATEGPSGPPMVMGFKEDIQKLTGLWNAWLVKQKKNMNVLERAKRFAIFQRNRARLALLNALGDGGGQHDTEGPFADLDENEFRATLLTASTNVDPQAKSLIQTEAYVAQGDEVLFEMSAEAKAEVEARGIDWRTHSTMIKNQGQCGSCWAFASVSVLESAWVRAGKSIIALAPQQLIDCNRQGNAGCNGGNFVNSFAYWQMHGSEGNQKYPYSGKQGACKAAAGSGPKVKTTGYAIPPCQGGTCAGQQEAGLIAALQKYGPLAIIIDASQLQLYKGGVIAPKSGCSSQWARLNHAVVLVGYSPEGKYWLVRNSWGSTWGEAGYFRLAYGYNTCGVADFAAFVTV